jgi:hypothetical protein
MRQQVRSPDEFPDAFHAKFLEDINQLDIPGIIHVGQALRRPCLVKQVC